MGLVTIPNQRLTLNPIEVDPCNIGDDKDLCTTYNDADYAYVRFAGTVQGNIVTKENFGGGRWTADTGWTHVNRRALDDGTFVHTPEHLTTWAVGGICKR